MKLAALTGKNILILGTGREARAAAALIAPHPFQYADDAAGPDTVDGVPVIRQDVAAAITAADVIIKSPGISLYDQRLAGRNITSLMNLWFAQNSDAITICITATKGKSTTSTLLTHVLKACGKNAVLCGNIGTPLNADAWQAEIVVVEVSSYQAADFNGMCDIGAVLNLYEDHFDWHGSLVRYHADKLNVLRHARHGLIGAQAASVCGNPTNAAIIAPAETLPQNPYLRRVHNAHNVAAILAITDLLGLAQADVLTAMEDFRGLAHRQYELGERDGVLYVDDSIATTPASTQAALDVYAGRPVTLIAGGYDRGIDYAPLVNAVIAHDVRGVICLGASGARIYDLLRNAGYAQAKRAESMADGVLQAQGLTQAGGVILLSPAAPSYGMFTDFQARGMAFAKAAQIVQE